MGLLVPATSPSLVVGLVTGTKNVVPATKNVVPADQKCGTLVPEVRVRRFAALSQLSHAVNSQEKPLGPVSMQNTSTH